MVKICKKCLKELPIESFPLKHDRPSSPERRKSNCQKCQPHHYASPGQKYKREYLITHPCVDCGEPDLDVLEFDHIDPSTKEGVVNKLYRLEEVKREIAKCDVRCCNCHRKRHAMQRRSESKLGNMFKPLLLTQRKRDKEIKVSVLTMYLANSNAFKIGTA